MDAVVTVTAAVLLAVVALRRGRRVATAPARHGPQSRGDAAGHRYRRVLLAVLLAARVALGLAALIGIAVLTRRLFG